MPRHWFAQPVLLTALAILPALAILALGSRLLKRRRQERLGPAVALAGLYDGPKIVPWRIALAWAVGLGLLAIGAAGPRWGSPVPAAVADGRDIVAVIDLSRSVLAQDVLPNRLERAKLALRELADAVESRGGHRLALVAFAGQAHLVCPLTTDYDQFRSKLADLDAEQLPPALRPPPGAVSGTRIGAGLSRAVAALDAADRGAQDIVLVTDGDDPAGDDEWRDGLRAVRQAGVPVYVVGIGDPERESAVPLTEGRLRYQGRDVTTRLHEEPLDEIGRRSGGAYLPARTTMPDMKALFRDQISDRPGRAAVEGAPPEAPVRSAWCFALALVVVGTIMDGGQASIWGWIGRRRFQWRVSPMVPAVLAFLCAAPAFAPDPLEWVRRGNAALAADRPADALSSFDQAAERITDPGLVAFNRGVALARLGRTREAELSFRRSLSDAEGPRRSHALYNLGTCLLQRQPAKEVGPLRAAVECFEQSLDALAADDPLRPDAAFNLELAKLLLRQARPSDPSSPEKSPDGGSEATKPSPPDVPPMVADAAPGDNTPSGDGPANRASTKGGPAPKPTDKTPPGKGNLPPLPDQDALATLTAEDTRAYLEQAAERITRARREQLRRTAPPPSQKFPEW